MASLALWFAVFLVLPLLIATVAVIRGLRSGGRGRARLHTWIPLLVLVAVPTLVCLGVTALVLLGGNP